jgi:membrane protein DedA with SNARE-associated domain
MARMRFRGVLLMSMLGMMAWNAILLGAGLMVGRNWNLVLEWVSVYNRLGMLLLVSLILAFLGRRWYRRRKADVAVDR